MSRIREMLFFLGAMVLMCSSKTSKLKTQPQDTNLSNQIECDSACKDTEKYFSIY